MQTIILNNKIHGTLNNVFWVQKFHFKCLMENIHTFKINITVIA